MAGEDPPDQVRWWRERIPCKYYNITLKRIPEFFMSQDETTALGP